MSLPPQKFREIVFQVLFSLDFHKSDTSELMKTLMNELKVTRKNIQEAEERAQKIRSHLAEIDAYITKTSTSYDFHRIQSVERNILRLAVFELLIENVIPLLVVISEAKRLAKKFSTGDAQSFVHAILETLAKQKLEQEPS
jgi:transcription antitermination protein NusB